LLSRFSDARISFAVFRFTIVVVLVVAPNGS
jgi:hypothetical protein